MTYKLGYWWSCHAYIAARYLCCYIPLTDPYSIFRKILVGPSWARGLFEVVLVCGPLLPHWGMFLLHEMDFYLKSLTSEMYYFRSMSHPNGFQVWAQKIRGSVWVLWVLLCGWKLCWDWNSTLICYTRFWAFWGRFSINAAIFLLQAYSNDWYAFL